jgi:hypothetical protein
MIADDEINFVLDGFFHHLRIANIKTMMKEQM